MKCYKEVIDSAGLSRDAEGEIRSRALLMLDDNSNAGCRGTCSHMVQGDTAKSLIVYRMLWPQSAISALKRRPPTDSTGRKGRIFPTHRFGNWKGMSYRIAEVEVRCEHRQAR